MDLRLVECAAIQIFCKMYILFDEKDEGDTYKYYQSYFSRLLTMYNSNVQLKLT